MADTQRPADPFTKMVDLATDQKLFESHRPPETKVTSEPTQKPTHKRDEPRVDPRNNSRSQPREKPRERMRNQPTRNEIQEFSFHLRDEARAKVQAEVPIAWQKELEDMAYRMNIGKLELYRYILGQFLGKVKRNND